MATHSRRYLTKEEYLRRLEVFKRNSLKITEHNNKTQRNYSLSINKYADLSNKEFKEIYAKRRASSGTSTPVHLKEEGVPEKVDWSELGAVNPVMDQGQCGSCWAFSAVGAIEGAHFVKTKELLKLSEQQMVDCARNDYGNFGCGGGDEKAGLRYAMKNPIDTEEDYPYTATDQKCKETTQSGLVIVTSVNLVSHNSPDQLMAAIAETPTTVAVQADEDFQFYSGGILDSQSCGTDLDHAVLAVGYSQVDGGGYYIVKNSWGNDWGEQGFIRVAITPGKGICGIQMEPSFPTT